MPSLRHVGVWLHPRRVRRLAACLPPHVLLVEARVGMADRLPVFESLIVDPLATDVVDVSTLLDVCARWRGVPTLVYTALEAGVAPALLALGRAGLDRVAIERLDDGPAAMRETLAALARESVQQRGLDLVAAAVGGISEELRDVVGGVLRLPAMQQSVSALAQQAGMHRRSLERWLRRDNLPCAADLMALARVAAAYTHLNASSAPVADAARLLGYATQRTLAEHAKLCAGMPLRELRRCTPQQFVEAVRTTDVRYRWDRLETRFARRPAPISESPVTTELPTATPAALTTSIGCLDE